ncbi:MULTISPECIES: bifunctional diguanylate cyclase/phosphodiesterase [Sulfurimonas]|uniref:bifunctional diguanylate cyclase/phosphodiesterase n=1 Tax=Sulfurimonas TaxID=202746 RepID=UPI0012657CDA|nr:bifunctional diguanylate cyclase/phosphodiesterase [Sulfurimonas indica]
MPIDITKDTPQIALKKLKARESVLRHFEDIAGLGSWEVDLKTKKSVWSKESYKIYGLKEGTEVSIDTFFFMLLPEYITDAKTLLQEAIQTGKVLKFTCKARRKDGTIIDLFINGRVIFDENKQPLKLIGTTQDITEITNIKEEAKELAAILEYSSNEIYIIELETLRYLYVNKGACRALGYTNEEMLQKTVRDINPYLEKSKIAYLQEKIEQGEKVLNRTIHQRKDGTEYHVQSYIYKLAYHGKDAAVIFDTDISELIALEKEHHQQAKLLEYQAYHDTLTDLPNRTLFQDRLQQAIITSKRNEEKFALLFIDLDQFKKINDSLGHHIGDEVLIESAKRFQKVLREEDTLSRLGGDEFTIILKNLKSEKNAATVAQKLINSLKKPIETKHHSLHISSSIGISIYPNDAETQEDLLKYADTAMYKAKDEGRNNFQFYSSEMTQQAFEKVIMENSLRIAIKENQFEVYFQPQYNAETETIIGMEALVRWVHPHVGIVPPSEFIPMAEENGFIIDIDKIIMKQAMQEFSSWYAQGLNPGKLALNLSMKQLNENNFITDLLQTMQENNFKVSWLELEVTEGQVMQNPEQSIKKLKRLSNIGISIAIDDFGTGYSSLSYLKKLPLSKLKIDRSFIKEIPYDEDDIAITKAIIAIAKSLNLHIIAEGVETKEQKEFMLVNGCKKIQGYYYSQPLSRYKMTKLLKRSNET